MECLNCGSEMMNHHVLTRNAELAYDTCEDCGSFWLDAGELDKMAFQVQGDIEYSSRSPESGLADVERTCRRCEDVSLQTVRFLTHSDIVLDRCGNCGGYWLDGGEIDQINAELESLMPVTGEGFTSFIKDVHVPFWHRRVRRKSSETANEVVVPPIKGAELKSASSTNCPYCETHMNVYSVFHVDIEDCPECRGVWLDSNELKTIKDRAEQGEWGSLQWMDDEVEAIADSEAMATNVSCPKCADQCLCSVAFGDSGVIIDWCPKCHGSWLDQGELQAIIDHLKSQINTMSSDEMRKKAYEEIKEIWSGPESMVAEILDAKSAISTFIMLSIYEKPKAVSWMLSLPRI